jgi:hypothetical protein
MPHKILEDAPWERLPSDVARALRPQLPALAEEIIAEIGRAVPAYQRPLEGEFGRALRTGVEQALDQFVSLIERPQPRSTWPAVYRALGSGEMRSGRSLDALQSAYRIGARLAWRRAAEAGEQAGIDAATTRLLAESIFAYIDELAAESVEGYAAAQSVAAGEHRVRRDRLLALLLADPPAEGGTLTAAAAAADWPLPRRVAAVAIAGADPPDGIAARIGSDALAGAPDGAACVVVTDPDGPGRREALERALRTAGGAIGPTVRPSQTARSLLLARRALALARRGALPGEGPIHADEHLATLALDAAAEPLAALADRRLAALEPLTPGARERLATTLMAWLRAGGSAPVAARELEVHPQTVRYRLARLRELLGDVLDDPEARFELELALRARTLASAVAPLDG